MDRGMQGFYPEGIPGGAMAVRKSRNGKGTSIGKVHRLLVRKAAKNAAREDRMEKRGWRVKRAKSESGPMIVKWAAGLVIMFVAYWVI